MDTIGLLLTVLITTAGVQDRDGAKPLLWNLRRAFPSVKLAWADGGYAGKLVTWARTTLRPRLTLQIVKRPGDLHTFQVLPRRWVVERTLAWIIRCRRTVRDHERLPGHHETIVYWAMTITMTRRLARRPAAQPTAAWCPGRLLYPVREIAIRTHRGSASSSLSQSARSWIWRPIAAVMVLVNGASWWIAWTRSTPAWRSAVASSLPASRSPYRIGSAK